MKGMTGIIAEYHPYHCGHAYLLEQIRKIESPAITIAVMGGNYTQRGENALWEKYTRAKAAVLGGVDLILELPFPFSCASAADFAKAGVFLLDRIGCDTIAFGTEESDPAVLAEIARHLSLPDFTTAMALARKETPNVGTPALARTVYEKMYGSAPALASPNCLLALEYLRALSKQKSQMKPLMIPRKGSYHSASLLRDYPSATAIRANWQSERDRAISALPPACRCVYATAPTANSIFSSHAILWKLASMTQQDKMRPWGDVPADLVRRIAECAKESSDMDALLTAVGAKQLTSARVRRMILQLFFDVTPELLKGTPTYTSVLAMNVRGAAALKQIQKEDTLPVLQKPVDWHLLPAICHSGAACAMQADAFYQLLLQKKPADAYRYSPIYVS